MPRAVIVKTENEAAGTWYRGYLEVSPKKSFCTDTHDEVLWAEMNLRELIRLAAIFDPSFEGLQIEREGF